MIDPLIQEMLRQDMDESATIEKRNKRNKRRESDDSLRASSPRTMKCE
jgi:hypothetical protein